MFFAVQVLFWCLHMLYAKSWCRDPLTLRVGPSKPHNWPRLKASICPRCGYNPIFRKPQTSFTERPENKRVSVYQSWLGCCERMLLRVILTCCFMFWGLIQSCLLGRSPFFSPCGIPELCHCSMWWRDTINCIWHLNQNYPKFMTGVYRIPEFITRCCHWFAGTLILTLGTFSLYMLELDIELKQTNNLYWREYFLIRKSCL